MAKTQSKPPVVISIVIKAPVENVGGKAPLTNIQPSPVRRERGMSDDYKVR